MLDNCPVCKSVLNEIKNANNHDFPFAYDCPRCGKFIPNRRLESKLCRQNGKSEEEKRAIVSHAIRQMQKKDGNDCNVINAPLIDAILKQSLPTPFEQKDIFMRWIGDSIESGGDYIGVNEHSILAIIGAKTENEFNFALDHLSEDKLVKYSKAPPGMQVNMGNCGDITLSLAGWKYYEKLKRGAIDSRKAFMAMEYGNEELDKIVDKHFKPAVADTGFELIRLNDNPKDGSIDDRLRVEIRNSRFLISDLTHDNNGAYWEAGYAEGLGKPVIYTCKEEKFDKEKTHFDTNHHLTVMWDAAKIGEAVESLKATIRATLPDEAKLSDD